MTVSVNNMDEGSFESENYDEGKIYEYEEENEKESNDD